MSLFRPEAVSAARGEWLAPVLIRQPPTLAWLCAAMVGFAMAVAAFLSIATYTRKATLPGLLMPPAGVVRLSAPLSSVVLEQRVTEGQVVHRGEVMFVLRPVNAGLLEGAQTDVLRSLDERRTTLLQGARLQHELTATRLSATERRLKAQRAELTQLDAELGAQQQRLALGRESLERQRRLVEQNFISAAQLQLREEEVLAMQAGVQTLRRQRAGLERDLAELEGEHASLPLQDAQQQGELQRSLAQVARERAEQDPARQFPLLAPRDGVVQALLAQAGQTVVEGAPLAAVMPAESVLQVQLLAPASAVGLLQAGQAVRIRYDAFPFQRYGQQTGRVSSIAELPLSAGDLAALPVSPGGLGVPGGEPRYRVWVRLDAGAPPMPRPLRAGMALQADVELESRRWIEWMFAPALGAARRL